MGTPSFCGLADHFSAKKTIFKYLITIILLTSVRAQEQYQAQFESADYEQDNKELPTSDILYKDERYFWAQTRHNINPEQIYDEDADPIHEGMIIERKEKTQEDLPHYRQGNGWISRTQEGETFEARYENVVDREMPPTDTEYGRPCSRGKACSRREESRAIMVEALKRNILMQLRMTEPPNITVPNISYDSPPIRRIMKKYGIKPEDEPVFPEPEIEESEWVEDETTKEKVISYARLPPTEGQPGCYFKFNEEDMLHSVKSALIWLYVRAVPTEQRVTLHFIQYQPNQTHPDADPVATVFIRKHLNAGPRPHWRSFQITNQVAKWFVSPSENLGIDIISPGFPGLVVSRPSSPDDELKPMLDVDLAKNSYSRRRKRSSVALTCTDTMNESRCCRYKFQIDFRSMGWDWIINPRVYTSYFCSGDCPIMFLQSNQNKMIAMQSVPHPKAASPCCAPTKMSPMSMLYFDNQQNIIYSEVPDMVVERCRCM